VAAQLTLEQILSLVGLLDDSPGDHSARDRFRSFLHDSVNSTGTVRDYIETCLRTSGPQYNRALQDLVNHTARLIGFDVEFGRYQGVTGEIGFDGIWRVGDLAIVAEVKTTDVYNIDTATLLGYVNRLISAGRIPNPTHVLGLYIFGRSESGMKQLADSIRGQNRAHELRIATTEAVLSVADLVQGGHLSTTEAVTLLNPAGVIVDDIVGLLARIAAIAAAQPDTEQAAEAPEAVLPVVRAPIVGPPSVTQQTAAALYLLTPVASDRETAAEVVIRRLLDQGEYVFGERTPGRKDLKPGDRLCFYETGKGVVAAVIIESKAEKRTVGGVRNPERFPWAFKVRDVQYFFDRPIVLDAVLRARLVAFAERDVNGPWAWFVQSTRRVTEHDFQILTDGASP